MSIKYPIIWLLVMLFALSATPLNAEPVENLYQSEQLVAESLAMPDSISFWSGMKQVLIKVSGSLQAAALVDELPFEPARYLREFRFESTHEVRTDARGNDYLAQRLILQFESEVIDSLLLAHGLKPLGKYRPVLLVWLVGGADKPAFVRYKEVILENAAAVAFPITVVLGHGQKYLKGNKRLSDQIRYSAKAYGKAFVVIVSVDSDKHFAWRLLDPDVSPWHSVKGKLTEELATVFELWIEASGIKVASEDVQHANTHQISVTSVKNVADYAAIMEYMLSLSSIDIVEVLSMRDEVLILSLQSPLEVAALTQILSLDRRMMLMRSLQDESAEYLHWRWIGPRGK